MILIITKAIADSLLGSEDIFTGEDAIARVSTHAKLRPKIVLSVIANKGKQSHHPQTKRKDGNLLSQQ